MSVSRKIVGTLVVLALVLWILEPNIGPHLAPALRLGGIAAILLAFFWVIRPVFGKPHAQEPNGATTRMPSAWTVVFAALMAADAVFLFWQPTPIVLGLFVGLGTVAAFFHWRDQPKVPDA